VNLFNNSHTFLSVIHDASLPSTTTYSSEGGHPTAIKILHKEEITLKSVHRWSGRELFSRLSNHVLILHNIMREGMRGHEDVNETPSSLGFLAEQILCYQRGFFPIAEYQWWEHTKQGYNVTSYWSLGPLGPPAVAWSQSNTRCSPEINVADKILSDSDRREGQKPGRNTAATGFCPYTKRG
jgi:hypothetical protein